MYRKISITIDNEDASRQKYYWVIAEQRVYVQLWKRAGRGADPSKNHVGDKGKIILNRDGGEITIKYEILEEVKENDSDVRYPEGAK